MRFVTSSFRHAEDILERKAAWGEFREVLEGLTRADVVAVQQRLTLGRKTGTPYKGGQRAMNVLIRERLALVGGWVPEPRLFNDPALEAWKMDFVKEGIGVEISFNHAEATAWQFTRLNIAGESDRVRSDRRIDVGIVVTATVSLKAWSRMDSTVLTFETSHAWLREMLPIVPTPIMLIGLFAEGWAPTDAFPGTGVGTRA